MVQKLPAVHRALPAQDGVRPELDSDFVTPRTESQRSIAYVWQEVLRIEKVGLHDNFFDLGGHSLLMAQVHDRLRKFLDGDVSLIELFRYPTIDALAKFLEHGEDDGSLHQQSHGRAATREGLMKRRKRLRRERQA